MEPICCQELSGDGWDIGQISLPLWWDFVLLDLMQGLYILPQSLWVLLCLHTLSMYVPSHGAVFGSNQNIVASVTSVLYAAVGISCRQVIIVVLEWKLFENRLFFSSGRTNSNSSIITLSSSGEASSWDQLDFSAFFYKIKWYLQQKGFTIFISYVRQMSSI